MVLGSIRTTWTLSSEAVRDRTNRLTGRLFKVAGALAALGTVFPEYAIFLILVPMILAAICSTINSYREYQNEVKSKSLDPDLHGARPTSLPPIGEDEIKQGLVQALDMASREVITTLHDSAVILDQVSSYSDLEKEGKLNVRVFGEMYRNQALGLDQIPYLMAERSNHTSGLFRLKTAKQFADGIIKGSSLSLMANLRLL